MIRAMDGCARRGTIMAALLSVSLLALLGLAGTALAAPAVTNTNDAGSGSLRNAIDNASQNDVIAVPAGTYHLTSGELVVDTDFVTIDGASAGSTIIDAGRNSRVFHVLLFVNGANPSATIQDVTVTGGDSPLDTNTGGGGILNDGSGHLDVDRSVITGNFASTNDNSNGHGGAGISNESGGGLQLTNSTISNNTLTYPFGGGTSGGAGVHSASGALAIINSTISGNSLTSDGSPVDIGGGGVHADGASLQISNSTISGNSATVPSGGTNGGGGVYSSTIASLDHATVASNATNGAGGGLLESSAQSNILRLDTSIVAANTPGGCAAAGTGTVLSGERNMETPGNTCNLGVDEFPNTDPQIGPLVNNGGPTPTRALAPGSPAVDHDDTATCLRSPGTDQRGVVRFKGASCDIGAYEFDGLSSAAAAGCSNTGTVGVDLFPPAGSSGTAAHFRVDGGPEGAAGASGSPARAAVPVPDGTHSLEYWGQFSPAGLELAHHASDVLMDSTPPVVELTSDQDRNGYTVGDTASFSVRASDAGTGLATDPSLSKRPIDTDTPHSVTIGRTATDNCGNETTGELRITVLPKPVLGKKVNLIPLSGRVLVSLPGNGASARASQLKGRKFIPIQKARQVPVGSLIDTRKGRVRLVSARDARARRVQAGRFYSGLFQILQSRKKRLKGLTELRLKGSSFKSCRPRQRGKRAQAALSKKALRRLRSSAKGRFRTRGRYGAATVRGTVWSLTDRCDGTLTKVTRGTVAVRDFRRQKTILVKKGKSYLARARKR